MARKSLKERTLEALLTDPDPRIRLRAAMSLDRIEARKKRKKSKQVSGKPSWMSSLTSEQIETWKKIKELEN